MSRDLLETFCLQDGRILNLDYHQKRVNSSLERAWNINLFIEAIESSPDYTTAQIGKWRISVTYNIKGIKAVRMLPYHPPKVTTLFPVEIEENFYHCKWADRSRFEEIKKGLPAGVEPLFILNERVTDTSFTNVVLEKEGRLITPSTHLLRGTKRSLLLDKGLIKEQEVTQDLLQEYEAIHLINAMLDPHDLVINI